MKFYYFAFYIFSTCLLWVGQASFAQDSVSYQPKKYISTTKIEVGYPELDTQNPVYKQIDKIIKDSLRKYSNGTDVLKAKPKIHPQSKQIDKHEAPYYLYITTKIDCNTSKYLSLCFEQFEYIAGMVTGGYDFFNTLTFEIGKDSFKILVLEDFVKDKVKLSNLIFKKLVEQGSPQEQATYYFNQDMTKWFKNYTISQKGIIFYIGRYDILDYQGGKITVTWQELGENAKIKFE